MTDPRMKVPGPDHPITLVRNTSRVVIRAAGRQIGETGDALTLHESTYLPVHYIPRGDLDMNLLTRTATRTLYPYKGKRVTSPWPLVTRFIRMRRGLTRRLTRPLVPSPAISPSTLATPRSSSGVTDRHRSICSDISKASSTSMPRYLTVLSSFLWPSRSWQARRFPVFL